LIQYRWCHIRWGPSSMNELVIYRAPHPRLRIHHRRKHQHLRRVRDDTSNARHVRERRGPMNIDALAQAAYIVAALLFILSLAGLSKHDTSRMGSAFGIIGMALALAATIWYTLSGSTLAVAVLIAVAVLLRTILGLLKARSVQMTELPELIAALHSLVGLAAVLVGWNGYLQYKDIRASLGQMAGVHDAEILIGVFIGAVTFTGSIVAYLKLSGKIKSAPLMLPGKDFLNLGALAAFIGLTVAFVLTQNV